MGYSVLFFPLVQTQSPCLSLIHVSKKKLVQVGPTLYTYIRQEYMSILTICVFKWAYWYLWIVQRIAVAFLELPDIALAFIHNPRISSTCATTSADKIMHEQCLWKKKSKLWSSLGAQYPEHRFKI